MVIFLHGYPVQATWTVQIRPYYKPFHHAAYSDASLYQISFSTRGHYTTSSLYIEFNIDVFLAFQLCNSQYFHGKAEFQVMYRLM